MQSLYNGSCLIPHGARATFADCAAQAESAYLNAGAFPFIAGGLAVCYFAARAIYNRGAF